MRGLRDFIKRRKSRLSRHVRIAAALLAVTFAFAGCGAGSAKSDAWNIKFAGKRYDLGEGIVPFVERAEKNGAYAWCGLFGRNLTVEDGVLKRGSIDFLKAGDILKKAIDVSFHSPTVVLAEDEEVYTLSLRRDEKQDALSKFTSAEGIRSKSKASDVPDYYVSLTGTCTGLGGLACTESFCTVVADGKVYDLSDYLDELPEKLTPEYLQQVQEKYGKLGMCSWVLPIANGFHVGGLSEDEKIARYEEYESYRNYYAIILAVSDLKEAWLEGDVHRFGLISFGFDEKGLSGFEYSFYGDKEKMEILGN